MEITKKRKEQLLKELMEEPEHFWRRQPKLDEEMSRVNIDRYDIFMETDVLSGEKEKYRIVISKVACLDSPARYRVSIYTPEVDYRKADDESLKIAEFEERHDDERGPMRRLLDSIGRENDKKGFDGC